MSYAGTYKPCPHDMYDRNCPECNGANARFQREYPLRMQHPDDARSITWSSRVITVYDAECPNSLCDWARHGVDNLDRLQADIEVHIQPHEQVARDWAGHAQG